MVEDPPMIVEFISRIEDFWRNTYKIAQTNQYTMNFFLVESTNKINQDINVSNCFFIFQLDHIDVSFEIDELAKCKAFMENLKLKRKQSKNHYYLLGMKIFKSKTHKEPIGDSVEICEDFLYFLSWSLGNLFSICSCEYNIEISDNIKNKMPCYCLELPKDDFSIIKEKYREFKPPYTFGNRIARSFGYLIKLRKEQFDLVQRSFRLIHKSYQSIKNNDYETAVVLLLCSIENVSQMYGLGEKDEWNEKIPFYQELKKIIYSDDIEESKRIIVFNKIGKKFVKTVYNQAKNKFKSFCIEFLFKNAYVENSDDEKAIEMLMNLYVSRSKYVHAGEILNINDANNIWNFNLYTGGGNVKQTFAIDGEKHIEIVRFPSFNHLSDIFREMLSNFVIHLLSLIEDEEDIKKYKKSIKKINLSKKGSYIDSKFADPKGKIHQAKDIHHEDDYVERLKKREAKKN